MLPGDQLADDHVRRPVGIQLAGGQKLEVDRGGVAVYEGVWFTWQADGPLAGDCRSGR